MATSYYSPQRKSKNCLSPCNSPISNVSHSHVHQDQSENTCKSPQRHHHRSSHKVYNHRRSNHHSNKAFDELQPNQTIQREESKPAKKVDFKSKHHPEYHFFSPKYKQHRAQHKEHRRKLSLEHREECYQFMHHIINYDIDCCDPLVLPPKKDNKKTLILDLDETLVHCSTNSMHNCDFQFPADFNGTHYDISGKMRPGLSKFLECVAQDWEVVIFTASTSVYANQVLQIIDPDGTKIDHRLFREACTNVQGNYIKNLEDLGRDLKTTVIVDNSPQVFSLQINNGIPIKSWYEDIHDGELHTLLQILNEIQEVDDVRDYIETEFEVLKTIKEISN